MKNALMLFSMFPLILRTFEIKKNRDTIDEDEREIRESFINDYGIEQINRSLSFNPSFPNLKEIRTLGFGSMGLILDMALYTPTDNGNNVTSGRYAAKIIHSNSIDQIPKDIMPKDLKDLNSECSLIKINMQFLNYLHEKNVPYIIIPVFDTTILIKSSPEENSYNYKNVFIMERAEKGDLSSYALQIQSKDLDEKFKIALSIITKLSYSLSRLKTFGIIHGDFKTENVMVRPCNDFDHFDVCPIIADWDFAYYFDDNTNKQSKASIRYTLLYRPPEMRILQENEENLLDNINDYKFTGKEDVYPLGVSIIEFFNTCDIKYEDFKKYTDLFDVLSKMVWPISVEDIYNTISEFKDNKIKNINLNGKQLFDLTVFNKNIERFKEILESKQKEIELKEINIKISKQEKGEPVENELQSSSTNILNKCKKLDDLYSYSKCFYALLSLYEKYKLFYSDSETEISRISSYIKETTKEISLTFSAKRPKMKDVYKIIHELYLNLYGNPFSKDEIEKGINIKWQDYYQQFKENIISNGLNISRDIIYISDESKEFLAEYPDILCPEKYLNTSYDNIKNDKPLLTYGTIEEICTNIAMKNGQSPKDSLIDTSDASTRSFKDLSLDRDNILSQSGSNTTPRVFGNLITQSQHSPKELERRNILKNKYQIAMKGRSFDKHLDKKALKNLRNNIKELYKSILLKERTKQDKLGAGLTDSKVQNLNLIHKKLMVI